MYVCVSVCLYILQPLGRSRRGINGQIDLKLGTLIAWMNPLGCFCFCFFLFFCFCFFVCLFVCFFSFFENFDFWALGTRSWTLNGPKSFKEIREGVNGEICLQFCTFIAWVNPWGCFLLLLLLLLLFFIFIFSKF